MAAFSRLTYKIKKSTFKLYIALATNNWSTAETNQVTLRMSQVCYNKFEGSSRTQSMEFQRNNTVPHYFMDLHFGIFLVHSIPVALQPMSSAG